MAHQQDALDSPLSDLFHKLSDSGYRYSMVLKDPSGSVALYSSHQPDDPRVLEILQQIVTGQEPSAPESNSASSTHHETGSIFSDENGLMLHRAIDSPHFTLSVRDDKKMKDHIRNCLRELQQLQCKVVAKAWIKVVEPKKQTKYPYKDKDLSKPPWWPVNVKHVEPDHLNMSERMTLMVELALGTKKSIESLWKASQTITSLSKYHFALLNEIFFVARAVRAGQTGEVLVSDWNNCTKGRREVPPLFNPGPPNSPTIPSVPQGHQRIASVDATFVKREVLDNQLVGEMEQTIPDQDPDDNYLNPAIAMEEDIKKCSIGGSLSLHQTSDGDEHED